MVKILREAEYGDRLPPPCPSAQLINVQKEAMAKLDVQLPEEYLEFLRVHDGLDWNGLQVYGAEDYESSPEKIMGVVEVNLIRRDAPGWDEHLCLAESGDDSYGVRLEDGRFCGIDVVSGDVFEEYESFDHMISSVLRELLE